MQSIVDEWKANAEKLGDRHFAFLRGLKMAEPQTVDQEAGQLHDEVFSIIDCTQCANCCRKISPAFRDDDIQRIARQLDMTAGEFNATYLRADEHGDLHLKDLPCPFLNENGRCSIYEVRPRDCKEYPHTNKSEFSSRTYVHAANTLVCPAAFWIVEQMRASGVSDEETWLDPDFHFRMDTMAKLKKTKAAEKSAARPTMDTNLPIFRLTITLEGTDPPIHRQVETQDCSLTDLHEIIQSCMGWENDHLHAFEIGEHQYTDLSDAGDHYDFRDSRSVWLSHLVKQGEYDFVYEYDFGDCWRHAIEIVSTLPTDDGARYPRCVEGRRACPPEDCGGVYGYYELLDALIRREQGEDNEDEYYEYDERLEWLGDGFDPERFSLEEVNRRLLRLRRWIGRKPMPHGKPADFAVGDCVRAKPGVVHDAYPDIPLSGWTGTITKIAWLVPIAYKIRWSEDTLAAAHPVYLKRCRRDTTKPGNHWLSEGEIELTSTEQSVPMQQPTDLIVRPLSPDDPDDRIRMALGLTSDDPLPADPESERQYLDYLKAHLVFPFAASHWVGLGSPSKRQIEVVDLVSPSPSPAGNDNGLLAEVRDRQKTRQVPLASLMLDETDPNRQYIEDYTYWLHTRLDAADYDTDAMEDYWEDEEDDDTDEGRSRHPGGGFMPRLADVFPNDRPTPQPIRRDQPPVGRNTPCPCGSGKKFKKCCLKQQNNQQ